MVTSERNCAAISCDSVVFEILPEFSLVHECFPLIILRGGIQLLEFVKFESLIVD